MTGQLEIEKGWRLMRKLNETRNKYENSNDTEYKNQLIKKMKEISEELNELIVNIDNEESSNLADFFSDFIRWTGENGREFYAEFYGVYPDEAVPKRRIYKKKNSKSKSKKVIKRKVRSQYARKVRKIRKIRSDKGVKRGPRKA